MAPNETYTQHLTRSAEGRFLSRASGEAILSIMHPKSLIGVMAAIILLLGISIALTQSTQSAEEAATEPARPPADPAGERPSVKAPDESATSPAEKPASQPFEQTATQAIEPPATRPTAKELPPLFPVMGSFRVAAWGIPANVKWGFIDREGNMVIAPHFDGVPVEVDELENEFTDFGVVRGPLLAVNVGGTTNTTAAHAFAIFRGGKWGFIDRTGVTVVEPQFDAIRPFHEGLAAVNVGGAVIDMELSGRPVSVFAGGNWGFVDETGRVVIKPQFDAVTCFREGMAGVNLDGSVNLDAVSPATPASSFFEGGRWGVIDRTGKIVIEPQFSDIFPFSEGLAAAAELGRDLGPGRSGARFRSVVSRRYGFINKQGTWAIQPKYDIARPFSEGLALVKFEGRFQFINAKDEVVLELAHAKRVKSFRNGLAMVYEEPPGSFGKAYYIDQAGTVVIEAGFRWGIGFSDGLAAVLINNNWGFVDRSGRVVIPPKFSEFRTTFSDGLAPVREENSIGYINKKGEWVYKVEATSVE